MLRLTEIKLRYVVFLTLLSLLLSTMVAWHFAAISNEREFNTLVGKAQRHAQQTSNDVRDSILRNLHYVAGVPETFRESFIVLQAVGKFGPKALPSVLSREDNLKNWVADPALSDLSGFLELTQQSQNVDAIFVVNSAGDCISASNSSVADSPIGANYADRTWFIDAHNGRRGVQYAVGRTSHIAGLYFSSPIVIDGKFMGAIVAKVDIPSLAFLTSNADAYVTDSNGVIIMAHDRYMELMAIPDAPVGKIPEKNRFELYRKSKFDAIKIDPWHGMVNLVQTQGEIAPHVLASTDLPEYGLKVFAEADLPELPLLEHERDSDFFLMALIADFVVLIAAGLFVYFQSLHKAKKKIDESEEQLRLMVSGVKDYAIVMLNAAGQVESWNSGAEKIYGYKAEEVIGSHFSRFSPVKDVEQKVPECCLKVAAKDGSYKTEGWRVRKDGSRFIANVVMTAVRDHNGRLRGYANVTRNITERKKSEAKLRESEARYKRIALHLDNVKEEEQERIAREIHDEMGATLTALKMRIHWLSSKLSPDMAQLTDEVGQIDKLVSDTIHTMRHVVSQLMPIQLHDFGFVAAVELQVKNFQKQMGIECSLVWPEDGVVLDENQSSALFRVLQESLNNIAKHAQATEVGVLFVAREHSLIMAVKDNGVGFDRRVCKNNAFGLFGIRARTLMVNGKTRIISKPGKGTLVVVSIPLAGKHARPEKLPAGDAELCKAL